jgi:hypothetical protein
LINEKISIYIYKKHMRARQHAKKKKKNIYIYIKNYKMVQNI